MVKVILTSACDKCGERFPIQSRFSIPAMVGFEMSDGTIINLCSKCLAELGSLVEMGKEDEFFKELEEKRKHE